MNGEIKEGLELFRKSWIWIKINELNRILKPNESERRDILIRSLSSILWKAGENTYSCVVLNGSKNCFEIPSSLASQNKKSNYFADGLTEKVFKPI